MSYDDRHNMRNSEDEFEEYKSNDMAMVTYLRLNGLQPQGQDYQNGVCYWKFEYSEALRHLRDDFAMDRALVNPKEFSRHFAITKRELFQR